MESGKRIPRFLTGLGVPLLQLIMTQVVTLTFLLSLLVPGMEGFPEAQSALFVVILGLTFLTGVFLTGWLALRWRWLKASRSICFWQVKRGPPRVKIY